MAEERARIAREIHDTVAQGLTGIVTQLEAAEELADGAVLGRLDTARRLARTSLVEVRRSIEALRPGPLRDARLSEAVETALRQRVGQLSGTVEIESSPGGGTAVSVTVPMIEVPR